MIIENIINLFLLALEGIIVALPEVSFTLPNGLISDIQTVFYGIGYFLPVAMLLPIFSVELSLLSFRLGLAVVRLIRSFMPF